MRITGDIGTSISYVVDTVKRTCALDCRLCAKTYELVLPHCVEAPNEASVSRVESFKRHVIEFVGDHDAGQCVQVGG